MKRTSKSDARRGARGRRRMVQMYVGGLLVTLAAFGDVLVTREGARIETEGAWEVRGRQVLFELPNGTLSSLRLADVDLEASREATRVAASGAAPSSSADQPRGPQKDAVLVLTNESLGLGPEGVAPEAGDGEEAGGDRAGSVSTQGDVRLVEWSYSPAGENPVYEVTGTLENRGPAPAEDLAVFMDIVAVDEETGQQQPERHLLRQARVQSRTLEPGALTEFSYAVTQQDLRVYGEEGFTDPIVSFDIQFRPGETSGEDLEDSEPAVEVEIPVSESDGGDDGVELDDEEGPEEEESGFEDDGGADP